MFFVTTGEDVAADRGWFPVFGGVGCSGGQQRLGDDRRRVPAALLLLLICPGHKITTLLTRALFPEWLYYSIA